MTSLIYIPIYIPSARVWTCPNCKDPEYAGIYSEVEGVYRIGTACTCTANIDRTTHYSTREKAKAALAQRSSYKLHVDSQR